MTNRRRLPPKVWLRFFIGTLLGVFGMGEMGMSVIPFHALHLLLGLGLLALGAVVVLGLMAARGSTSS